VVLPLSPLLWRLGCNRQTEILYTADIGMIILRLGLKPGSTVIESGTGTGALSTAIGQAIMPNGRLRTYEYNQERSLKAK
jgi:tRNA (adenine57-N1/adenine58-N1)-methyltransferase